MGGIGRLDSSMLAFRLEYGFPPHLNHLLTEGHCALSAPLRSFNPRSIAIITVVPVRVVTIFSEARWRVEIRSCWWLAEV